MVGRNGTERYRSVVFMDIRSLTEKREASICKVGGSNSPVINASQLLSFRAEDQFEDVAKESAACSGI